MLLAGGFWLAANVIPQTLVTVSRSALVGRISIDDSLVIGQKILARADGEDTCIVNVFLVDVAGKAVPDKTVVLTGMNGRITESNTTDNDGKASFEVASVEEGQFEVNASVDGVPIPRGVIVTFRN